MDDLNPILNVDGLCAKLAISPNTARRLLNTGAIPGVRIGRQWRVPEESLDRWLREQAEGRRIEVPV